MIPKHQVEYLINHFTEPINNVYGKVYPTMDGKEERLRYKIAKESALRHINLMITHTFSEYYYNRKIGIFKGDICLEMTTEYWKEIKEELINNW